MGIKSMIYRWLCTTCHLDTEVERPMADSAIPPNECSCPPWEAPHWQRIYEAPMLMRESYPDGHKRKGWTELKEAQKLEKQAAVTKDRDTKRAIKQEIRKMGVKPSTQG